MSDKFYEAQEKHLEARKELAFAEAERDRALTKMSLKGLFHKVDAEMLVTDPNTGGQKGQKEARFSLIPTEFLLELAHHYGRGARKYEDRNWERGYKWSLSRDAMGRHLAAWELGERYDAETDTHHLIAAIWHLIALYIYDRRGLGTDDITLLGRVKKPETGGACAPETGRVVSGALAKALNQAARERRGGAENERMDKICFGDGNCNCGNCKRLHS